MTDGKSENPKIFLFLNVMTDTQTNTQTTIQTNKQIFLVDCVVIRGVEIRPLGELQLIIFTFLERFYTYNVNQILCQD